MFATTIVRETDSRRSEVEAFIRDVYRDAHRATPNAPPPNLMVHFDERGRIACAAGLRDGAERFFSEAYLDAPIETTLSAVTGSRIDRGDIVEVTTLVSRAPRRIARFLDDVAAEATRAGFTWSFFTVTRRLGMLLERHGVPLRPLADADRRRIDDPDRWGDYYACNPRVYASRLVPSPSPAAIREVA
jgi:hypothetical protein